MVTIGVDAHKEVHVAVAVGETGRTLGTWRGRNGPEDWAALREWAMGQGDVRQWGIEGTGNYGRGLAQHLVTAGERVFEVNPRLTASGRRRARRPDKNDRLDAQAVAMVVLREAPALPQVLVEDETALADLLSTEREAVLAEVTRIRNQLHQVLLQVDPGYKRAFPHLQSEAAVRALERYASPVPHPLQQARAAAVQRLAARLRLAMAQLKELTGQIEQLAQELFLPLAQMCGTGLLTAGSLAGLIGPHGRFHHEAQVAAYAGTAPLEASSAGRVRHRLNRGGNRRLNAVLYRIVLTQLRHEPRARTCSGAWRRERPAARRSAPSSGSWCGRSGAFGTSAPGPPPPAPPRNRSGY